MTLREECWDLHIHLGRSRDGASLSFGEIGRALDRYRISRAVVFAIDESGAGPTYEKPNRRVLRGCTGNRRLIPFVRLNPGAGARAVSELRRAIREGARGVKLHPRAEKFSPPEAEDLIDEIENEKLPIFLHTSHEENCRPLLWEKIFRRHRRIPYVLFHGGKDAYEEAAAVACRNRHLWVETSTLSYRRSAVLLDRLGASRLVFGSDLPYSHPAVERLKLELLLKRPERRKVFQDNPKRILGE